jgi:twitching motility protein PilT
MEVSLETLLKRAVESNASDIHLKVGSPPTIRIDGELRRLADMDVLKPGDTETMAQSIFTQKAANQFKETGEADFAYGRHDLGRFRVGVFRQRGSVSLVMRRVMPGVPMLERIGLPPIARKFASEERGMVLVTGPSGSGRTTTVAAIVEHINQNRPVSIVTIEDPIEVLFPDKMGAVAQREVGVDTPSYADAIRKAMRQDADVIMVSEISDADTAMAAVAAAETGHLVVGAMHTSDPAGTIERLIGLFPQAVQKTARLQVAHLLRGVISQRLLDTVDGTGRVLASEILSGNAKVQELIAAGGTREQLIELMKESEFFGMQTFDQSLFGLVKQRRVSVSGALAYVRNTHEFRARALEAGVDV